MVSRTGDVATDMAENEADRVAADVTNLITLGMDPKQLEAAMPLLRSYHDVPRWDWMDCLSQKVWWRSQDGTVMLRLMDPAHRLALRGWLEKQYPVIQDKMAWSAMRFAHTVRGDMAQLDMERWADEVEEATLESWAFVEELDRLIAIDESTF